MEDAVTQQCAYFKPKRLREAIDELDHYITNPFTTDFMIKVWLTDFTCKKSYA